jgi:hypothetical protein
MENKVANGSILLHNISHGMMSNVETSAYLWDNSSCTSRAARHLLKDWSLDAMLSHATNIYTNHPLILVTSRNVKKDLKSLISKLDSAPESIKITS